MSLPLSLWRLVGALFFIALWWSVALIIDSTELPAPNQVLQGIIHHAADGELIHHSIITLKRVILSFAIAMLFGTAIGIWMGRSPHANALLDDMLILALNMPALVTIILCYIWVGLNETAAILAVAINKIPLVVINMREGARAINHSLLEVGYVYKLSRLRLLQKIILPQLYPALMSAARNGLALIWKIVLVVELLGRSDGIGFQLHHFFQFFDIQSVLAYSFFFIAIILVVENLLLRPLDKHIQKGNQGNL